MQNSRMQNNSIIAAEVTPVLDARPGSVQDRLLTLVRQIIAANSAGQRLSADEPLTKLGLTSVDMVNLMLAVEAEFDITIPAADISPRNFRSVSTIEAMIVRIAAR